MKAICLPGWRKPLAALVVLAAGAMAQAPAPDPTGTWLATMHIGAAASHYTLVIARDDKGALTGWYFGSDSRKQGTLTVSGQSIKFTMPTDDGPDFVFQGTLNAAGDALTGTTGFGGDSYPTEMKKQAGGGG